MRYLDFLIRPARDDDYLDLVELIMSCFAEYQNCIMDIDGEMPELRRIASYFSEYRGQAWVAERGGRVLGSVGISSKQAKKSLLETEHAMLLTKLYVHRTARRKGLANHLAQLAEDRALELGADSIELWTDTRFESARAFYHARDYTGGTRTRELRDLSNTVEYYFKKDLAHRNPSPR